MDSLEIEERQRLLDEKELNDAMGVVDAISDYVNTHRKKEAFVIAFKRMHRTLQQSSIKLFLEVIEDMAKDETQVDLRNKASKEVAKDILEGFAMVRKAKYMAENISPERAEEYVSGNGGKPSYYLPLI